MTMPSSYAMRSAIHPKDDAELDLIAAMVDGDEEKAKAELLDLMQSIMERGEELWQWASEYAEPGYGKPEHGILFGDWNEARFRKPVVDPVTCKGVRPRKYTPPVHSLSSRVSELVEATGLDIELEWDDEWSMCDECNRAVRTSEDSYFWKPAYAIIGECSLVCHECILEDPEELIQELIGDSDRADTIGIDLTEQGFEQFREYVTGWHSHQNDSPAKVMEEILHLYPDAEVVFQIVSTAQFDTRWTAWFRNEREDS